jgi:hypothetical protein
MYVHNATLFQKEGFGVASFCPKDNLVVVIGVWWGISMW